MSTTTVTQMTTEASTATLPLGKAITAGLIEITNPSAARSVRRSYRVLVSSQDVKANSGNYTAMPTPKRVEELLSVCDAAPRDYPF